MWWLWKPAAFLFLVHGLCSLLRVVGWQISLTVLVLTSFWTLSVLDTEGAKAGLEQRGCTLRQRLGVSFTPSQPQGR